MIRRSHHWIVAEDHFHRHLDLAMFRGKLSHHSRNLPTDLSPAHFLISGKRRSDPSAELCAGLDKRFHRKYLAGVRSFHVRSTSPVDLAILDHRLERIMRPSGWVSRDHVYVPIEEDPQSLALT